MKKYILGIDLGTYNSEAAVATVSEYNGETIVQIHDRESEIRCKTAGERYKSFPSFVWYNPDAAVHAIGQVAKEALQQNPRQVVWGIKRLLGKTYSEAREQGELDRFEYVLEPDESTGRCFIIIGEKKLKPEDVCRELLSYIKARTEEQTGLHFTDVIISIPAYFDALHASPIVHAAKEAGFQSIKTIPEPVAAAIAYRIPILPRPLRVLVFDLGAGTLDVTAGSLSRRGPNPSDLVFQCRITTGNTHLGGVDMDDRMTRLLCDACGIPKDLQGGVERAKIRYEAEQAKIRLSTSPKTDVEIDLFGERYSCTLSRLDLERALRGRTGEMDIIGECREQVRKAIRGAEWDPEKIDELLLIGGPSTMPPVLDMLKELFVTNPNVIASIHKVEEGNSPVNPMEAVARGAALSLQTTRFATHPYGYGFIDMCISPGEIVEEPKILIPRGSNFPVKSKPQPISWFMRAAETKIELIQQVPVTESHGDSEYRHLGFIKKARSIAGSSKLEITMGLNGSEELYTTIRDVYSGEEAVFTGISHLKRIPINLPRKTVMPDEYMSLDDLLIVEEVDKDVLKELVDWVKGFKNLIGRILDDAEKDHYLEERSLHARLDDIIVFYIEDDADRINLEKTKMKYTVLIDTANSLLHGAIEQKLIDNDQYVRLQTVQEDICRRLIKRKKIF